MPTLVYSDADGRDRSFAIGVDAVTVGRAPDCAIRSQDPRVSRMHARFFMEQGSLWVEDLGSTHGIYVGPNKVQRAQVPIGEMILVGSLLIRLVPASGTVPPPMGLHGTLATWLDLERKTRAAVEEERDAFAKRVNEMHQALAARADAGATRSEVELGGDTQPGIAADAIRQRDEAEARAAAAEQALAAVQSELTELRQTSRRDVDGDIERLRAELAAARDRMVTLEQELGERAEWSTVVGGKEEKPELALEELRSALEEARAARATAERAFTEANRESQTLRKDLDQLRRESQADLEIARLELAKTREAKMMVEAAAGVAVAERLAAADQAIAKLQRELSEATHQAAASSPDPKIQELTDLVTALTGRVEKAEKDLGAAQIRAQGAERNLSHANAQAAKAESRAAQLDQKIADLEARSRTADAELATARARIAALDTQLGGDVVPLREAEERATRLTAELATVTGQFETSRARLIELEQQAAAGEQGSRASAARASTIEAELATATSRLAEADKLAASLQSKLDELGRADVALADAARTRDDATSRASDAEKRVAEANRRADDAEKRASAADTMAKAMAKDVAEALRRAADADAQKRSVARDFAEAARRIERADAASATAATESKAAEERARQAEARAAEVQQELTAKLEAATRETSAQLESGQRELATKLAAAQRELAAERKTALALVDRKTQLERELADARTQIPLLKARAETAEQHAAEDDALIVALEERVQDLEASLAAAEAAAAEARQIAGSSGENVAELRARVADLEKRLGASEVEREAATSALRTAHADLAGFVRAAEERATSVEADRARLEDALQRASEAERKTDALTARAEAADLAIGRAGALQRQLDEALSKLAWLERDASSKGREPASAPDAAIEERLAAAERRAQEAETQGAEADRRATAASKRADELADQLQQLQRRAQLAEAAAQAGTDAARRIAAVEEMLEDAERRAHEAEEQLAAAGQHVDGAEALQRRVFEAQERIAVLEREVANAENVRSFAAETEREIAQLQRDLRDARSKLTQITLERDRLASELRDTRGDSETTSHRVPLDPRDVRRVDREYDPEVTAQADLSKYEPIIAKAGELQQRVSELEKEEVGLRKRLAEAEQRLHGASDDDGDEDGIERTHTGSSLPIEFAEHLNVLEESIDSLRANMRAASDETAMMDQTESVVAVSSAVSQAAEHVERARAAIRAMNASLDIR